MSSISLWVNLLGWIGSAMLVIAYYLNSKNYFNAQDLSYQLLNLIGSLLLVINTIYYGAYPSTAVNVIWVFIGTYYLISLQKNETKVH